MNGLPDSESRRANGKLRSEKADDALATMLMTNGSISAAYPKDLKGLFSLDGKYSISCWPRKYANYRAHAFLSANL